MRKRKNRNDWVSIARCVCGETYTDNAAQALLHYASVLVPECPKCGETEADRFSFHQAMYRTGYEPKWWNPVTWFVEKTYWVTKDGEVLR